MVWEAERLVVVVLVGVRLASVGLVQTWFVPDEHWQATEVAHRMVYGYGYETWEWREGIRGALYPSVLALLYKILSALNLDSRFLIIHFPRMFHAILFTVGDYFTLKLSRVLYGRGSVVWTGVCLCTAWFLEYCAPRTLTSCAELVLLAAAFSLYPWRREAECSDSGYLWLVGVACAVRPTAAIPFIPLCLKHICLSHTRLWLLGKYTITVCGVLAASMVVDGWFYGHLILTPARFASFNVLSGLSGHYGVLPWHWYLSQGLPATLTTHALPLILAALTCFSRHKELLYVCLWSTLVFSCLSHKEFRFLLPVLPLCLCIAGDYIAFHLTAHSKKTHTNVSWRRLVVLLWLVVPNLVAVLYFGLVHQRGPLDVMEVLHSETARYSSPSILFLMPCHSTPYYSHMHQNIPLKFLTCEPNLQHQENYTDEADMFYEDPLRWLQQQSGPDPLVPHLQQASAHTTQHLVMASDSTADKVAERMNGLPTHIVLFDALKNSIEQFLSDNSYQLCHKIFHAHLDDGRRSKHILVYCQ